MQSKLCICSILLFSASGIGLASAQVCSGEASFDASPARFYASTAFGSSEIFHAGVALGGSLLFGSVEVGMTTYGRDETLDYRASFGAQLSRRKDTEAWLCPRLLLSLSSAQDVHGTSTDYKEMMAGGGVDAGYVAFRKGNTRIVPTVSFGMLGGRIKYNYSNGSHRTRDADAFGIFAAGVGFGLNKQLTISPSVALPLGLSGETPWYRLTFSIRRLGEH